MEKKIDVVYVLGSGSNWNNNEIRYSLRSIEKNGIDVGQIFIVGEFPAFLSKDVIHIKADDIFNPNENADGNIITKVLAACADPRLSDDFLFINDDHILLKLIPLIDIPAFHKGDLNDFPEEYWKLNYWRGRLKRTRDTLNSKKLTAFHFDCHTPIVFNKELFPEIMSRFNYQEGLGLTMKSLYGNIVYSISGQLLTSEKKTVFKYYTVYQLNDRLSKCSFMSFNDCGLNNSLKLWLEKQFPNQSRWEISQPEDRIIEISKWLNSERNYWEGVRLFEKYMSGANLIRIFRSGETASLRKKLEYKLTHTLPEL